MQTDFNPLINETSSGILSLMLTRFTGCFQTNQNLRKITEKYTNSVCYLDMQCVVN